MDNWPARPNTARQVAVDAFDEMDELERMFLIETAGRIIRDHEAGRGPPIEHYMLDEDEKLAIWSLLPPRIRAALKGKP